MTVDWPDPDAIPDDPTAPFWTSRTNSPWPTWVTGFRPWQIDATREIVDGYRRGAKVMMLDAPTGAGKTLIGEMVRRCGGAPTTYLSSTISLQQQFVTDFPYARKIMGATNYLTELGPPWVTCGDCQGPSCGFCTEQETCPYRVAKKVAFGSEVAVANTAYWLHAVNHAREGLRGRPGLIIDECDTMESALMGFVELYVGEKWIRAAGIGELKKGARRDTVTAWFVDLGAGLDAWVKANRRGADVKKAREVRDAARMASKAKWFAREWHADGIEEGEGSRWIRDYPKDSWCPVVFRAVKVDRLGWDNAWRWVGTEDEDGENDGWVLGMSATVVSADEWIESNGFAGMGVEWGKVVVPSPFPAENRPVYAVPVADMKMQTWEQDLPALIRAAVKVLERHPDDKTLIHTTSWKLTHAVLDGLRREVSGRTFITHARDGGAKGRDDALERHRRARGGSVLVSPSMDRGVDLPGDDCRVQIVCKVPYPYLGNRQIKERTRLPGGQTWFTTQTARTLVQMTGRGVRSADDHATTYILDKQFTRWYGDAQRLLPKWWKDAVKVAKVREFV